MVEVWPSDDAVDERLAEELAAGGARAAGEGHVARDALVDRIAGRGRDLDPVTARLALRAAVRRATTGRLQRVAGTRGFLSAAARFVAEAERAGLLPDEVERAAAAVPGADGERLRVLAAAYAGAARVTATAGSSTDARRGAAVRALRGTGPVDLPSRELDVHAQLMWEPADAALLVGLARRLQGGRLRVRIPWAPERPAIYAGVEPVLEAIEAQADLPGLELVLEDLADRAPPARAALVRALFGGPGGVPADAAVTVVAAPTPAAELRAIAARARILVDDGTPPEAIAVATRAPGATISGPLGEELARVGLRLDDRRGPPVASSPPARLALAILALPGRGFPREDVLALVASRYVAGSVPAADEAPPLPAHRVVALARALGVRELAPTAVGGGGLARLARSPDGARAAAHLEGLLAPVATHPELAPLGAHAAALARSLTALDVPARARAFDAELAADDPTLQGPTAARLERAIARDQAAMDALEQLLADLPRAAAAAGFDGALSRDEFAGVLGDLMAELPLPQRGVRGGAVRLLHLRDLAGRRLAHVFVPGLNDGAAPARTVDDGVYGERERRALNRALGRRALPTAARRGAPLPGHDEAVPAERTPFENLLLVHALVVADGVTLSYPTTDGERELARSPFVDELLRVAPGLAVEALPPSPVPELHDTVAPADALARVALELWADPAGRLPGDAGASSGAAEVARALAARWVARMDRLRAVAAIERERWGYFAGERPPGPYVGHVGSLPTLARRAGGTARAPVPAGQLDRLANCPFTVLAGRVLGVEAPDEAEDAPASRNLGRLAHRCLERFYRERAAAGALPLRGDDVDRAALEQACAATWAEADAEGATGHPVLWELGRERLASDLWRLVTAEAQGGAPGGGVPAYFEVPFGLPARGDDPLTLPALVFGDGDLAVHVAGRIDRIDLLPAGAGAVVLDYKLGGRDAQREKLRPGTLAVTALQLPLYAAAATQGLRALGRLRDDGTVDAAFVSVKDASATKTLREALGADEASAVIETELPARVAELGARLRSGAFEVQPVDCRGCAHRTVCRVVKLAGGEEDEAA